MTKKPEQPAKQITEMSGLELRAYFDKLLGRLNTKLTQGEKASQKGLAAPATKAKGRQATPSPADAVVLENPVLPPQTRGRGSDIFTTWWGKAWLEALDDIEYDDEPRLARGRTYARNGSVVRVEINKGHVHARVRGSEPKPYHVTLTVTQFSDAEWESVLQTIGTQASFAAKLLAGELPTELSELFEALDLTLFPHLDEDLAASCTCGDWSAFCKHVAAVYYLVGNQIDRDPLTLLHLRGRTRDEILGYLREQRIAQDQSDPSAEPAGSAAVSDSELTLDQFWQVAQPQFIHVELSKDPVPAVFRTFGEPPVSVRAEMHAVYDRLRSQAFGLLMPTESDDVQLEATPKKPAKPAKP